LYIDVDAALGKRRKREAMLTNYLTLALRHLKKRKLFSFINIFGLSVGVAVCLVIIKYVDFELSYDRHHHNGAHIYRTILTRYLDGKLRDVIPLTGYGTGPALKVIYVNERQPME
jgi:putative ABC transport system permease protein